MLIMVEIYKKGAVYSVPFLFHNELKNETRGKFIMKKIIIISVILLATFLVIPGMGQTHLGFIGGINIANFSGDELLESGEKQSLNYSSRTGFAIGGVLDLALGGNASLRFEPMYLQKGAEGEEEALGISIPFAYKLAYLEVPAFIMKL